MSTPMRHGPSQQGRTPSQQHLAATPTPQASTPFSNPQTAAAFSPRGPRSSPQQFKKSPGAFPTAAMVGGGGGGGANGAMVNFDSPNAAAALGALNVGIHDLGFDAIGVGGLVAPSGRTDEEDRKKRMEAVIDALWAQNSGRVSNQGLERLALHLNLECLWEDVKGAGDNTKTLVIAGQTMAVEVGITNHIVHEVSMAYSDDVASVNKHVDKASAILLKDLSLAPGQSPLTKRLTQFRANLERLATLDKLSVGLNCHEAIAGIWETLERLHRWDVERLREDPALSGMPDEALRIFALCLRHGCPLMHARGRIGLSFDYWKENRKLPSTTVDGEEFRTWGILIECARAAAGDNLYHGAVRISDKWIGPNIEKSSLTDEEMISTTGPVLDWLEPASTLIPPSEDIKVEGGLDNSVALSGPRPPEVVFVATFDPPVIVPHAVAAEIYKISVAPPPPLPGSTFDALMFPIVDGATYDPSEPREVAFTQNTPAFPQVLAGQKEPVWKAHRNTLYIYKPVYGHVLTRMNFAHPKDLVAMLPLLRQYAFLSLLLANSLKPREGEPATPGAPKDASDANINLRVPLTTRDDFSTFMSQTNDGSGNSRAEVGDASTDTLRVDITLTAHPVPRLEIVFPFRSHTANILLEIQLGGKVHIVSDNIFSRSPSDRAAPGREGGGGGGGGGEHDHEAARERVRERARWAAALETMENLGSWIELVRFRLE
ncbi:mediator of RNA polymerase II transcription subunit 1-domain-containing protein [Durotheca rogersii]|uniref:mediator of RNA polymerase II transcription subunit 1-domain-containing protein n=1 Tax=Durotheca rogersii TaxID=419775 RepID=UPI00221E4B10|nr:mediator of RNA polymerase II transcription subunit 1-domain-containing protein [Durotheca rogersii]KAI5855016.1 mediator of RNA polymerase II transcription subunit 1-domain-containing protein [Durotheca rogersii]